MKKTSWRVVGFAIVPLVKNIFLSNNYLVECIGEKKVYAEAAWDDNWDGLKNSQLKDGKRRTIILVRHGQYETADDDKGRVLTPLGREQAECTGKRLAILLGQEAEYPPLENVYYSTMTRAIETHDIILKQLLSSDTKFTTTSSKLSTPCDLIREGAVCRPVPDTWKSPTEEDYVNDNARVEKAFQKYFHRSTIESSDDENSGSDLFVCHGNVIRYFVMRSLQLPPEAWLRTSVANASITVISIAPSGRVGLRCMSDTGHMSPSQITYN